MEDLIYKYALQNAVKFKGKANVGAVIGKVISEMPSARGKELAMKAQEIVKKINSMTSKQQIEELNKVAPELLEKKEHKVRGLPELKNVKGKVVMRIAPYPSGPLHIGNARTFVLNDAYTKKYKGRLFLVIDDTIGSEQKTISKEAYKLIPEGLTWLEINFDKKIVYKSDRLKFYYKYATEIIKKGKVYVCTCPPEIIRDNRAKGIACKCRAQTPEQAFEAWKKMFKQKEGEAVLRLKTDMQHRNPAFRDRVLFRISERKHPRVGKKYKVWPLLEFSWAVDDRLLGITHILRGKELRMESEMEEYIWDIFGWKHSEFMYNGLFQIEGVKISKSKSKKEVESGEYIGWDDPRTWSLQALKRRGFNPEAIRSFLLSFGVTETEITVPISKLYTENKKVLEPISKRYFFVENLKKIKIGNAPKLTAKIPLHPDNLKMGCRILKTGKEFYINDELELGKTYRLMHLFNFKDGRFLSKEYDPSINAKLIHWLPVSKDLIKVEILMPDGNIKKGLAEKYIKKAKVNESVQFERFAFCRLDKKTKNKMMFWYTHQ